MPRLSHQLSQTRKTAWSTFTHLFWVQKQNNIEQGSKTQVTQETQVQIPPVEIVNINELKVDGQNPNRMTAQQTQSLIESIKRYGFLIPIVTNKDLLIADGEQRYNAGKSLNLKQVPVIRLPVQDVDRRLLRQILNKIRGEHVLNQDAEEYRIIMDQGHARDLQTFLGLKESQLNALLRLHSQLERSPDLVPPLPNQSTVKPGDLYILNGHRVYCGDATKPEDVHVLFGNAKADSIQTDPPYGVYGDWDDSLRSRNYTSGARTYEDVVPEKYEEWTVSWLKPIPFAPKNTVYIWINGVNLIPALKACETVGIFQSSLLIWAKQTFVLANKDYFPAHEVCIYGWHGSHKFYGKTRRGDVFFIQKPPQSKAHPTQKPVDLIQPLIEEGADLDSIVYDAFGGSGTTLIACERTGRRCYMMEKEPLYCSVIISRWEAFTGQKAKLVKNGEKHVSQNSDAENS
jgi:DNA modification methylase